MGWAIPASIGIHLARREPCVVITGNGCMPMHGMEIQTALRYRVDISYIVFNNSHYGATCFDNRNNIDEMSQLPTHDWVKFADAFGARGKRVFATDDLQRTLADARDAPGSFLNDLVCSPPANEYKQRARRAEVR
jgi:acetolactate synthase I/II/III large subunit